ncbi:MAG: hypothetical protein OXH90_03485, partial [Paracoccaceae bacterium]|nr:hypothetical protein [Paracoccaceae bacterium]
MGTGGAGLDGYGLVGDRAVVGSLGCGIGCLADLDGNGLGIREGCSALDGCGYPDGLVAAVLGESGLDVLGCGVGIDREGNAGRGAVIVGYGYLDGLRGLAAVVGVGRTDGVGDGGTAPVVGVVDVVVDCGEGHGLCGVPDRVPGGGEGEGGRFGGEGCAVGDGEVDDDIAGRFAGEDDGVGALVLRGPVFVRIRIILLGRYGDGGRGYGDAPVVVVGDGYGHIAGGHAAVVRAAGGEGLGDDGLAFITGIVDVVVDCGDGNGLCGGPDPGPAGGEGEGVRGCGEGCAVGDGEVDHHIGG